MAGGCRDCSRCTEVGAARFVMILPRLIYAICFGWWTGLFTKKCPICKHRMSVHSGRTAAVGDA